VRARGGIWTLQVLNPELSPVGSVELAPARDRVSDAGAADGVGRLHNDKRSLLQRGYREVLRVVHWLQEAAIAGPERVLETESLLLPAAHLGQQKGSQASWGTFQSVLECPSSLRLVVWDLPPFSTLHTLEPGPWLLSFPWSWESQPKSLSQTQEFFPSPLPPDPGIQTPASSLRPRDPDPSPPPSDLGVQVTAFSLRPRGPGPAFLPQSQGSRPGPPPSVPGIRALAFLPLQDLGPSPARTQKSRLSPA
jgi:hypothetical protein